MENICKPYQINVSGLKLTNKGSNNKKKDLVKTSSKKSIILLNDWLEIILINVIWW